MTTAIIHTTLPRESAFMIGRERIKQPRTPKKQKALQDPTPRQYKMSSGEWEKQSKTRQHISEEMQKEMLQCPVNAFLAHYSPFLPDDVLVEAAKRTLMEKQLLILNKENQLEWQEFDEEPRRLSSEADAFKPLEAIANALDNGLEGLNGRQRNFSYRDCPNTRVMSEIGNSNFRTDACFMGGPNGIQNKYIVSSQTVVVAEFKKSTRDYKDNREKLVSCASFIMNDDPRRNWIYGITVENTEMAVWYFSRSHSVKSETFDFTTDIDTLIRVFLSFIYATREEMGYDPTIHRIEDNGLRYVYEIPNETGARYFKTIELLSHRRVVCITGRKTRVWRAIEVKGSSGNAIYEKVEGGKMVALKDIWLDEGSKTEKQNLDAIFECLSMVKEEDYQWAPPPLRAKLKTMMDKKDYKRYFMGIVCDSFGLGKSKAKSSQATPAPEILQFADEACTDGDNGSGVQSPSTANGARQIFVEDSSMLEGSTQKASSTYSEQNNLTKLTNLAMYGKRKPRSYTTKQHYRLVYEEIGQSLDRVDSLETAFAAVSDAYIALVLVYLAGWMHRDVSAGNIIAVKRGNGEAGGKLSDFEFAKCCEDESGSPDPKTGTPFFMPYEIHSGMAKQPQTTFDWDMIRSGKRPQRAPPRLRDRPQHGVESLWWVKLYLLIYRVKYHDGNEYAKLVFMNAPLPSNTRRQLFESHEEVLEQLQDHLHPDLRHHRILDLMQGIRDVFHATYVLEKPDPDCIHILYGHVFGALNELVDIIKAEAKSVELHSTNYTKVPKKRDRAETSPKPQDDDEYKNEEGSSSDPPTPKKMKQASSAKRK